MNWWWMLVLIIFVGISFPIAVVLGRMAGEADRMMRERQKEEDEC